MKEKNESELTFWDHLDELRATLMRIACVVVVLMLLSFFFKDELFHIILMPKNSDFYIYRFFEWIGTSLHIPGLEANDFHVRLINTKLSGQFLMHMNVSFYAGIILASPYILYQLFRFVSPALYENEKTLFYESYHMGICAVPFGGIIQLFSDISFYFPFPCSLSGQS